MNRLPSIHAWVRALGTAAALGLSAAASAPASPDRVAEASSGRVPPPGDLVLLPLDDQSMPWRENLKLTLESPRKYPGNPVMGPGPAAAPDGYGALLYGTVIKEGDRYRMWYIASPRVDSRIPGDDENLEHYRPVAYAESRDGIHWDRPDLGLVEFRGSRKNNLVGIAPANEGYARAYDFVSVILDPADPDPGQRYKMAYITYDLPRASCSAATAVSADGLRWQLGNAAMFTQGHFENTSLTRFDGLYYLSGQDHPPHDAGLADGSPAGRVMKVFFSGDFRHWSAGRALGFYRADYRERPLHTGEEVHMGAGLWNRGNVILGLYGRWHGGGLSVPAAPGQPRLKGLTIDLGLVVSNDAIHYREPVPNHVFVPRGPAGAWDSVALLQSNAFANTADQTLVWYTDWDTGRPAEGPTVTEELPPDRRRTACAVGLMTLPRDRFGAFSKLRTDDGREASCLTRSLQAGRASRLYANVDGVAAGAALRIELVDDTERPLPGYSAEVASGGLKVPLAWSGGRADLPAGGPFRIKATWPAGVDGPRLYALYVEAGAD